MNDRPEPWDWPKPVQSEIAPEDLAMIVQDMKKSPGYEEGRARRIAALKEIFGLWAERTDIPKNGSSPIRYQYPDRRTSLASGSPRRVAIYPRFTNAPSPSPALVGFFPQVV